MSTFELRPETRALLTGMGVFVAVLALAALIPEPAVSFPGISVLGLTFGAILLFAIPFVASVKYHSPALFDVVGHVWSFADGEIVPFRVWGTDWVAISVGGYIAPKKYLSGEDVTAHSTTLVIAPARLVEEIGQRFIVVRSALERATPWESKALFDRPEFELVLSELDITNASIYWAFGTTEKWCPVSRYKPRIDFTTISEYLAASAGELGSRGELVEESWRRTLADMERIAHKAPPPPPQLTIPPPEKDRRRDES